MEPLGSNYRILFMAKIFQDYLYEVLPFNRPSPVNFNNTNKVFLLRAHY